LTAQVESPQHRSADGPYWEGARRGELLVQHCDRCGHNQLYARLYCTRCGGEKLSWVVVEPTGTLYTYTVVRRAPSEAFRARAPYVVAMVDLDAGPRLMGNVVDCDIEAVRIGMRVTITFDVSGALPVPEFRKAQRS
jgi:uncharacterized OB-fold protein